MRPLSQGNSWEERSDVRQTTQERCTVCPRKTLRVPRQGPRLSESSVADAPVRDPRTGWSDRSKGVLGTPLALRPYAQCDFIRLLHRRSDKSVATAAPRSHDWIERSNLCLQSSARFSAGVNGRLAAKALLRGVAVAREKPANGTSGLWSAARASARDASRSFGLKYPRPAVLVPVPYADLSS